MGLIMSPTAGMTLPGMLLVGGYGYVLRESAQGAGSEGLERTGNALLKGTTFGFAGSVAGGVVGFAATRTVAGMGTAGMIGAEAGFLGGALAGALHGVRSLGD